MVDLDETELYEQARRIFAERLQQIIGDTIWMADPPHYGTMLWHPCEYGNPKIRHDRIKQDLDRFSGIEDFVTTGRDHDLRS